MICGEPERFDRFVLLSASNGPWEAVDKLPEEIAGLLTDEIGNPRPRHGDRVQIIDTAVLPKLQAQRLFLCFRAVHERWMDHVVTVPTVSIYEELRPELVLLGWDVCTDGWSPASYGGAFPIMVGAPGTAKFSDEAEGLSLNRWALFESLEDAISCCEINDRFVPVDAPWYPVAVCTDQSSYSRLTAI
jgi:hypothetical protein